ncbi:MAG: OmpA family protein [Flavobacteriales bacterium]|nr:OmpA family protein [Flavobacteriales bacterium]
MKLLPTASLLFLCLNLLAQPKKHSVFFEHDSYEVSNAQEEELMTWLNTFSDTATKVEVIGFTDHLGSNGYNQKLSEERAKTVADLLERQGKFHYRMSITDAKGESEAEQFEDARRNPKDRRVDVMVSIKPKPTAKPIEKTEPIAIEEPQSDALKTDSDLLVRAEVGQTVVLRNLNFFPGRHYLIPAALPELERLAQILKENPTMEIEIQGHICCKLDTLDGLDVNTGTYSLSFNRSEYIFNQLVLAGIEPERMSYRGFAGGRPLVKPEMTETDRQRNRRVEIKILKK